MKTRTDILRTYHQPYESYEPVTNVLCVAYKIP